ncbi:MAG: hypothetical protein Q8R79_04960, partial [Legionellaceae bacterium]|nr:hypothetical protein [Legionellaceae bacterium]
ANIDLLIPHYERQIRRLNELYQHKEDTLPTDYDKTYAGHHDLAIGNVAARVGSVTTNVIRDSQVASVLGMVNVRDELTKASGALQQLSRDHLFAANNDEPVTGVLVYPPAEKIHAFKDKLHSITEQDLEEPLLTLSSDDERDDSEEEGEAPFSPSDL